MVVYTKSEERKRNFEASRANAPSLQRHVAVVGTETGTCTAMNQKYLTRCPGCKAHLVTWHRTHCCDRCENGCGHSAQCDRVPHSTHLNSVDFITNRIYRMPGKVGCNLSHQSLWVACLRDPSNDWVMINEDDAFLTERFNLQRANALIKAAKRHGAHYVRTEPSRARSASEQHRRCHLVEKVADGLLYRMLAHAGMASYLVDRVGLRVLLSQCPYDSPQDMLFARMPGLKALYFCSDMVEMKGCHHADDHSSALGSIIMCIN